MEGELGCRVRSQRDLYAMPGGLYLIFQVMVNIF